ncbi:hypothetical protein MTR67_022325 [Solanum verrucosum]|uniref:Uncharacterized protein n=1 Tax=Solanum verrucosum TaxID=315347 RepID=A0AAF0QUG9_SOLVR|nr:hypothetical protein MTR67_022325 [Solanum verrucosum]
MTISSPTGIEQNEGIVDNTRRMDAAGEFRQSFFWLRLTLPLAGQAFYRKTMLEDFCIYFSIVVISIIGLLSGVLPQNIVIDYELIAWVESAYYMEAEMGANGGPVYQKMSPMFLPWMKICFFRNLIKNVRFAPKLVLISQECPCSVDEDSKDEDAQILREVRMRWFRYVKRWWEDAEKRICEREKGNGDQRGLQGDESNPHQYGGSLDTVSNMRSFGRGSNSLKSTETMRLMLSVCCGIIFGLIIGISFPSSSLTKLNITSSIVSNFPIARDRNNVVSDQKPADPSIKIQNATDQLKIWVPSNPRGAERLPPRIVASESDYYPRRLWGKPSEDLQSKPKYLVTFTVGIKQKYNIDAAVKKFSDDFTILLFHYDGKTTEWDEFEWSKKAIHVSVRKQTKWWYAKRFLHPDIVAPYDYIFIWDEDLGVEHFDAKEYIKLVKKHGLEISQPGLDPRRGTTWQMTKRRGDREVHTTTEEKPGWCADPHLPPCAAFVEIMAPVFSRDAWRCVWYMIQNDLVHGWGLDFALRKCVDPAHKKIGVVDSQWIVHQGLPSLGNEGEAKDGKAPWKGVRDRCRKEWKMFQTRVANAEKAYFKSIGVDPSNLTSH